MAQISCDLCNEEQAVMLQTNIDTGDVLAVGVSCLFPLHLGSATAIAQSMPADVKTRYRDDVASLAATMGAVAKIEVKARKPAKPARGAPGVKTAGAAEAQADAQARFSTTANDAEIHYGDSTGPPSAPRSTEQAPDGAQAGAS